MTINPAFFGRRRRCGGAFGVTLAGRLASKSFSASTATRYRGRRLRREADWSRNQAVRASYAVIASVFGRRKLVTTRQLQLSVLRSDGS